MEKTTIQSEEQTVIERYMLLAYAVYSIVLTILMVWDGELVWLAVVVDAGWFVCLLIHLIRFRDYQFRAYLMAGMLQTSIVLWSVCGATLSMTVPLLVVVSVSFVFYGIPGVIYIAVAAVTFLTFYHILIVREIDFSSENTAMQTLFEVLSVYLVDHIIFILFKKRKEYMEKQIQTFQFISDAERSKDDFLANVSHEIRTPVNTICGMSEIVLREELADSVREDVFNIQAAGRNLLSIVSDVLDFTELQSGKMKLAEETYNITSTLNDIINMSMARVNERRLELVVDCSAGIPSNLSGDEQKIRRIIMNLVNNAIKFTVEGCVTLAVEERKTEYGINLIVRVRDTGIGMKEESLERLFTSFNQVDTRRNRQEGGIGLGLAVSQAMIDMMGGFITVSSEFGKGSEFQFVIPQKVVNSAPIVSVHDPDCINAAIYIDMEKYDRPNVRKEYGQVIYHLIEQLKVKCHICRNLPELKRRAEREVFSHIFISIEEYEEDREYFDGLSQTVKIVAVIERSNDMRIQNRAIRRLYKPFFILPVAMLLNDEKAFQGMEADYYYYGRFIAPDVNVLLVDDNLMNIRVLEGLLAPYKIRISMATSGAEALEKIETMGYDAVLMDHMMPEMDGIETLRRIRQKQGNYFKKIPIIAVTANAVGGMREVFLSEGFQDFMAKPIEVSVLERVLRRNLPQEKLIYVEMKKMGRKAVPEEPARPAELSGTPAEAGRNTDLPPGLFNEEMGMTYCGGLENYIKILQVSSRNGQEDKGRLQGSFDRKDWKNYTIYVHGLKSNMLNIGVEKLSAMAKDLEHAGKRGDEAYILTHHDAVIAEYERILGILGASRTVHPHREEEILDGLETLEEPELDRLAMEFEDAAYAFDSGQMSIIAEYLEGCSYNGCPLKAYMEPVLHKVEMSDYLSAAEAVSRLKDSVKNTSKAAKDTA